MPATPSRPRPSVRTRRAGLWRWGLHHGTFDVVGHFNQAGWWKGVSQMLQGMHFGLGIYDECETALFADGFESGDTSAW